MTTAKTFRMTAGPYIPPEHEQYDLLPYRRANGGEVFSYPAELNAVEDMLFEREFPNGSDSRTAQLIPYGMASYAEYFDLLASIKNKYRETDPELADALGWLAEAVKRMNVKEEWSVVRYVGDECTDSMTTLTKGRCYYWPCSREHPVYEGVIDDEEFTSYLYPCDPTSWEIVLDPMGMAARALSGEAETVSSWYIF